MAKHHFSLQVKFLSGIALVIAPVLGVIFTWTGLQNEKLAEEQVKNQARILARQIVMTRQWISDCGGVMVPKESKGAKNITCFFDDEMETARGRYQRFTPSMVTRKLSEYSFRQDMYTFRLASLTPLNPENRPDEFEREALVNFKVHGRDEMHRFDENRGKSYFQYMIPLYMEKGCLECHKGGGDSRNVVRGGLSVFLSVDKMKETLKKDHMKLAAAGSALILLTIFTLFTLTRKFVIKPLRALDEMTGEIARGNLTARVDIHTGDEFQRLCSGFNLMAENLSKNKDVLEEKVSRATRELSEVNQELKTLDQLKSDFLANMSHELRTPLTVIRGGVDYLNRTIRMEDNRNYLDIIDKNLARLIKMVTNLFDFTKIEAKKMEFSSDLENLTVLLEEVVEIINPLAMDKGIVIRFDNPGDIFLTFDLERIEQVLVNLIENAIKFSDLGAEILIEATRDRDSVTVSVTDQGPGIPVEDLQNIFTKFTTLPQTGDGKTKGTGLGLAICKAIVEAHHGHIRAESVNGASSAFSFTLPDSSATPDNSPR